MGNCLSAPAPDELHPSANDEKPPVYVEKSIPSLLHEFEQGMLEVEDFKFDGHPLVIEHMDEDVRQSFGELYGGRQWPPTALWVEIFDERWKSFRESKEI
ncbi:hypothetical protein TRIATDRAFT_320034 [Trichoderma atroviride IMI 206040]|uniref:Uncharacterized protein n=1 Tax=Hypocrea atroviridis (strain ATCC 20476 / IMI 206040) TaxID=452589 RepID=G9P2C7_HYPAI|nr:uncharacterized protein TRIATDRAFT_320034 [Trichoderma atroviride IMI 206040]EHK42666.1 hypothetical protein TRIATDRAFT_320034 [Trichoderma atroviride IMI 206040]